MTRDASRYNAVGSAGCARRAAADPCWLSPYQSNRNPILPSITLRSFCALLSRSRV